MASVEHDEWSFVSALSTEIASALTDRGYDEEESSCIAEVIIQRLQKKHGGEKYYLSSACKKKRNDSIIDDWRAGIEKTAIASKHNIHISTVNRIISKHLGRNAPAHVGFGDSDWLL